MTETPSTDFPTPHRRRTALITGATSGIGHATAIALARAGFAVVVHGRDQARGEGVCEEVRAAGGEAELVLADLTDADATRALGERAGECFDGVDVLVNNAFEPQEYGPTAASSAAAFDRAMAVNARAPFVLVGLLAPRMAERGDGAIVNITMAAASRGVPGIAQTSATKGALEALTRSWTAEYGASGVRVNTLAPGVVLTPANAHLREQMNQFAATTPAGRPAEAEEVAKAVAFLASPQASFVYGARLAVDGGMAAA